MLQEKVSKDELYLERRFGVNDVNWKELVSRRCISIKGGIYVEITEYFNEGIY